MPGPTAGAGPKDSVAELVKLVIAYAKQETVDPVVKQAKVLGTGIAGAGLLAVGTVLLGLGFLRALQAEFGGGGRAALTQVAAFAPLPRANVARVVAVAYPYGTGAHLSGDWSWVPYMGGALFCVLVAGFCALRILKGARP
jgi:hypothetical protein